MAKKPKSRQRFGTETGFGTETDREDQILRDQEGPDLSSVSSIHPRLRAAEVQRLLAAMEPASPAPKGTPAGGPQRDWLGRPWTGSEAGYDSAWRRTLSRFGEASRRVEDEQQTAQELLTALLAASKHQRRVAVCLDRRLHSVTVCQELLSRSWAAGLDNPSLAVELAELAVSVAAELSSTDLPSGLVNDYKVRSWSYLGNARRILSDLRGAEKAFELAESLLNRSTGDPLEAGRFYELRASLSREAHRLEEADRHLAKARGLYRRAGSQHLQGRIRISQALVASRRDQPARAAALLRRGLSQIDSTLEPRLHLVAAHNLAFYLSEIGDLPAARQALKKAQRLHQELGSRLDLARLHWLEGRLALTEGAADRAERALVQAREVFVELQIGYDTALVSLDLAGVYARQGRAAELRRLAEEVLPIFRSRDLGREVMAALLVLRKASQLEAAPLRLIEELSSLLRAAPKGSAEA